MKASDIIEFWYATNIKKCWFNSTPELDQKIHEKYVDSWNKASSGKLDEWSDSALGCLALIIILDQFPLNMFRGQSKSFSTEAKAIKITKKALSKHFDHELTSEQQTFLYMPLMHSEDVSDQKLAISLFDKAGLQSNLRFAKHHHNLIQRFGRFPHRNKLLGRNSTKEEIDYLNSKQAFLG